MRKVCRSPKHVDDCKALSDYDVDEGDDQEDENLQESVQEIRPELKRKTIEGNPPTKVQHKNLKKIPTSMIQFRFQSLE